MAALRSFSDMVQNYKIFVNDFPLVLTGRADAGYPEGSKVIKWDGSKENILSVLNELDKSQKHEQVVIVSDNEENLKNAFDSCFELIEAAGGIVINSKEGILMMVRRNKWDLPKGKIDDGESVEHAALREVKEETGLKEVAVIRELASTYHAYWLGSKRILKRTYWFEMKASIHEILKPQINEDITLVKWIDKKQLPEILNNTYKNIAELVHDYMALS